MMQEGHHVLVKVENKKKIRETTREMKNTAFIKYAIKSPLFSGNMKIFQNFSGSVVVVVSRI